METKTARNAVRKDQLANHLKHLDGVGEAVRRLLVVTPDNSRPSAIESLADNRLVWTSFAALDQAIDELLADKSEVISEREAFLLRELQAMLAAEGLTGSATEIVVVPARHAWPEYNDFHAYVCQPQRHFQLVKWMGFYSNGQIHPLIPKILKVHDPVLMVHERHSGRPGELVEQLLEQGLRKEGESNKVFLLSAPDDPSTLRLDGPIINDLTSESGQTTAFTQNQRYVAMDRVLKAKRTSDLVDA